MEKYFKSYIAEIEEIIKTHPDNADYDKLSKEMLVKLQFLQHERLMHLLVLILFTLGLFGMMTAAIITEMPFFYIGLLVALGFVLPYVIHYYFLENTAQKFYSLYDKITGFLGD
jgi:hypothetical protein